MINHQTEQLFHAALQQRPEQRQDFIRAQCGADESLCGNVLKLLAGHDQNEADDFILDRPMLDANGEADVAVIVEKEGDTIERYRLLECIGEGGMGRVYMAEQTAGVRRRVALKIIKLGMDTRQVIARFEAERQAMALFDHPNITRVLDAGTTSTGRPYFVMELVRGTSLTDYVESNNLPLEDRLRLFGDVCRAVHHAHQKGVIHRDIKPSNILVTQYDGRPVPKVIDFGIAKAIGQQQLTDKTLFTRYASMVGTPQYMSPEQAEMTGLDIDTRADIYSLGVILYELITGSAPLSAKELRQLNPLALYETLRDADIETPSSRVARRTQASRDTADRSPINVENLHGDLDSIVMKAISRDRRDRYDSANALAADVQRFLDGDPVEAVPASRTYLLKKVLRKYRTAAVSAIVFTIVLASAAVLCLALAVNNYRTNQGLSSANAELAETVEQLREAEAQIRSHNETQQYESAISIAVARFEMDHWTAFEDRTRAVESAAEVKFQFDDGNPIPTPVVEETFVVPCADFSVVTALKDEELLADALKPIRSFLDQHDSFTDRLSTFDMPEPLGDSENIEGMELWDQFVAKSNEATTKTRHQFYRHLLKEYRRVFGDNDPRVASALNLLAASLMEIREYDEAEAHLRESLAVGGEQHILCAKPLLEKVVAGRASMKTSPRRRRNHERKPE